LDVASFPLVYVTYWERGFKVQACPNLKPSYLELT